MSSTSSRRPQQTRMLPRGCSSECSWPGLRRPARPGPRRMQQSTWQPGSRPGYTTSCYLSALLPGGPRHRRQLQSRWAHHLHAVWTTPLIGVCTPHALTRHNVMLFKLCGGLTLLADLSWPHSVLAHQSLCVCVCTCVRCGLGCSVCGTRLQHQAAARLPAGLAAASPHAGRSCTPTEAPAGSDSQGSLPRVEDRGPGTGTLAQGRWCTSRTVQIAALAAHDYMFFVVAELRLIEQLPWYGRRYVTA